MADLSLRSLVGTKDFFSEVEAFSMQYHLTVECDQYCKHCYMFDDKTYANQKNNPMKFDEIIKLIDEYLNFVKKMKSHPYVVIIGGDPLLSPLLWPLLEYLSKKKVPVSIAGNSYHITDSVAKKLKDFNVLNYQISLDGMKEMNDFLRKSGSFDDALRAFKILHNNGINTLVMFTLSKLNKDDLIPLYRFVQSQDYIDSIAFDKLVPTGNGEELREYLFTPEEYRDYLLELYKYIVIKATRMTLGFKDNLWKLLLYELGLTIPFDEDIKRICTGCFAGISSIAVLADGTVLSCRRLGMEIGKFPDERLEEIIKNNELVPKVRNLSLYNKCYECPIVSFCRGCLAMKKAINGDILAEDPFCWR